MKVNFDFLQDNNINSVYYLLSNIAGVEHVEGDMFENVPKGDAIFMKVSLGLGNILLFNWKNMV